MKKIQFHDKNRQQYCLLILLILLLFSCNSQSQSQGREKEKQEVGHVALNLKFTSGISALFQDSKGNYWIGSQQEGVCLFDGESLTYFTIKDGLNDNQIRSIQEDNDGQIWLGTAKGVNSYDGQKMINHTLKSVLEPLEISPNEWAKTDGDLWFSAGIKAGVYRYDGQELSYLAFPVTQLINPDNVYLSTGFAKGKNDMLWMATYAGVFGYNGQSFTIINDETLGLEKETGQLHIRSVLEDSQGNLWIGNNGIGLLLFNGDTTINFSEKMGLVPANSQRSGSPSPAGSLEHIFSIEEDHQGNIWFGDRDTGVWKYDGKIMTNYTNGDGLPTSEMSPTIIYQDNHNGLLFGTGDGSVYVFNGVSFERKF